jgi:hypothetical protein
MKSSLILIAAGAIALAPGLAMASPPSGGGPMTHGPRTTTTTTTTPTATGTNHLNSPAHATGQPNKSCETTGSPPGNSASSPGSPFNEEGGTAGSKYAGEQPQNSRNTASVSQYDVACANQPH